jgi:hypothetical protein
MAKVDLTTEAVAAELGCHRGSVWRFHEEGLGGCVVRWSRGPGYPAMYDPTRFRRWRAARACTRWRGARCETCAGVLAGLQMMGEHLRAAGHGCREECPNGAPCCFSNGIPCSEDGVLNIQE